jgi:two-component system cell cycle sensor histidine kinase/response regulator CckA
MNETSHPTLVRPSNSGPLPAVAAGRVLVVDDDDAVGLVLSRAMARLGFRAEIGADGPKSLSLFNVDPSVYVLVLLDFKLPGMDSREVYEKLREQRPDLPIVLMSGYNRQEALDKSAGLYFAGFLHKPFNMETLAAALRHAIVR